MKLNPNEYKFEDIEKEMHSENEPLPAGEYLVAADKFTSRTTKNGEPMYRVTFVVVDGPLRDRRLFVSFMAQVSDEKRFPLLRWAAWAQCAGVQEVIDTEDLSQVERLFLHKVVKVQVKRSSYQGNDGRKYESNDIQRFLRDLTGGEETIKQNYEAAIRTMGSHSNYVQNTPPDFGDDDIPF